MLDRGRFTQQLGCEQAERGDKCFYCVGVSLGGFLLCESAIAHLLLGRDLRHLNLELVAAKLVSQISDFGADRSGFAWDPSESPCVIVCAVKDTKTQC